MHGLRIKAKFRINLNVFKKRPVFGRLKYWKYVDKSTSSTSYK